MSLRNILIVLLWLVSILFTIVWTFENPEKIEKIKSNFKKNQLSDVSVVDEDATNIQANSFNLEVKKMLSIEGKTAFVINQKDNFDIKNLEIFTQTGNLIKNLKPNKLDLPEYFTLQRNGGIKTIISFEGKRIALISSNKNDCFFASLILIENKQELFRTKCLPELAKNNDFNGLGSSNIHLKNKILFSLGTPEKHASKNSSLAQDNNYLFGKIIRIKKEDILKKINNENEILDVEIYSKGHRVPQGLAKINNSIFNVEHGPKGGDELNLVIKDGNYGWPIASYGTNYLKENGGDGKSISSNHELNNFNEPLLALVPSIGISSLNNCPNVLKKYYKKKCLMALSLYGNNLRKGHSIIIFLLNDLMTKVDSFEIIKLDNLVLRHFVTNDLNELYEDENGDIYVSADKKGIYKVSFQNFR